MFPLLFARSVRIDLSACSVAAWPRSHRQRYRRVRRHRSAILRPFVSHAFGAVAEPRVRRWRAVETLWRAGSSPRAYGACTTPVPRHLPPSLQPAERPHPAPSRSAPRVRYRRRDSCRLSRSTASPHLLPSPVFRTTPPCIRHRGVRDSTSASRPVVLRDPDRSVQPRRPVAVHPAGHSFRLRRVVSPRSGPSSCARRELPHCAPPSAAVLHAAAGARSGVSRAPARRGRRDRRPRGGARCSPILCSLPRRTGQQEIGECPRHGRSPTLLLSAPAEPHQPPRRFDEETLCARGCPVPQDSGHHVPGHRGHLLGWCPWIVLVMPLMLS